MSSANVSGPTPGPAPIFAALGDPTRLKLITQLSAGRSQSIAALSSDIHMTRQAVTKHLSVLETAGIVHSEKIGREKRFAFNAENIRSAHTYLEEVSRQWDSALTRLQNLVER